jgi:hypothetical protein
MVQKANFVEKRFKKLVGFLTQLEKVVKKIVKMMSNYYKLDDWVNELIFIQITNNLFFIKNHHGPLCLI